MPKIERRGSGLMEREVVFYDMADANEAEAFATHLEQAFGTDCRDEFAASMHAILKASSVVDFDEAREVYRLPRDCPENSAEFIAHAWIVAHGRAEKHRAEIVTGKETLYSWSALLSAVEEMGVQRERLWWRCIKDPSAKRPPEALAISGRAQVKSGERGNAMRTDASFAAVHGEAAQRRADALAVDRPDLSWTAIRNILAREFGVSAETIKKKLRNPRKAG